MKKFGMIIGMLAMLYAAPISAQEAGELPDSAVMLAEASQGVERLEEIISEAQKALEDAKAESDVTRIDYINSLLVNARGFLSVVQNGESNLKDAIARNDVEAQQHHYKLVQLGVSKGEELSSRLMDYSSGIVGVSGTTVSNYTRKCSVEPCLEGEEYYEPSVIELVNEPLHGLDIDASAYL